MLGNHLYQDLATLVNPCCRLDTFSLSTDSLLHRHETHSESAGHADFVFQKRKSHMRSRLLHYSRCVYAHLANAMTHYCPSYFTPLKQRRTTTNLICDVKYHKRVVVKLCLPKWARFSLKDTFNTQPSFNSKCKIALFLINQIQNKVLYNTPLIHSISP